MGSIISRNLQDTEGKKVGCRLGLLKGIQYFPQNREDMLRCQLRKHGELAGFSRVSCLRSKTGVVSTVCSQINSNCLLLDSFFKFFISFQIAKLLGTLITVKESLLKEELPPALPFFFLFKTLLDIP